MKVYVLAHCYGEGNNAEPRVFTTYEAAKKEFDLDIEDWTANADVICSTEIYNNHATIIYSDDTLDSIAIYEVEVQE